MQTESVHRSGLENGLERGLTVNGEPVLVSAANLVELLAGLGYDAASVATAVNGTFVPRAARAETRLADGDAIEIVAPRQGG